MMTLLSSGWAGGLVRADNETQDNLFAVAEKNGHYTHFIAAAKTTGLDKLLQENNASYTVFAPTDQAFEALEPGVRDKLFSPASRDRLNDILDLHVVEGDYTLEKALQRISVTSEQGQALKFTRSEEQTMVNDARILNDGISASNGRLYGINHVLMPRQ
ncbi:fasciclin domain-containing protein [Phytohalomonas tamaricis]|uniref:fasciclin domain-containing protein n=1 Tax=Phytohalomonas tamaricis TaxID=2081032 RepID=UPI001319E6C0|nr:fasciclin domain-containing protein [Phytohalomonas tamaricis]